MVERNLAKVEVESSRLFSRSNSKGQHLKVLSFFVGTFRTVVMALMHDVQNNKSFKWRGNKAVMYRIANPASPVRLRAAPPSSQSVQLPCRGLFCLTIIASVSTLAKTGLSGGIGRHSGLKIRRFVNSGRTGSIPVSGTKTVGLLFSTLIELDRFDRHFHPVAQVVRQSVAHFKTG